MSPTSYQTAPPRSVNISQCRTAEASAQSEAERGASQPTSGPFSQLPAVNGKSFQGVDCNSAFVCRQSEQGVDPSSRPRIAADSAAPRIFTPIWSSSVALSALEFVESYHSGAISKPGTRVMTKLDRILAILYGNV